MMIEAKTSVVQSIQRILRMGVRRFPGVGLIGIIVGWLLADLKMK